MKMRQHRRRQAGMSRVIAAHREYRAKFDALADGLGAAMVQYLDEMQSVLGELVQGVRRYLFDIAMPPADPKEWH